MPELPQVAMVQLGKEKDSAYKTLFSPSAIKHIPVLEIFFLFTFNP